MTSVHIHAPKGYYIGQVRPYGARRWLTVTGRCRSDTAAMASAVRQMHSGDKRARVLFCADWYEPTLMMECAR